MAFTGYGFIVFFFAIVLPSRWLLPARYAGTVLLVASAVFYLTWGWKLAVLLGALTLLTYGAGQLIKSQPPRVGARKVVLAASIVVLLGVLATFKYAGFFLSIVAPNVKAPDLPLPLGISFYVFEMISYVVDVYRGDAGAKTLPQFALYVSYFPHLIAGPIVRASELLPQLQEERRFDSKQVSRGMFLLLTGFVKKTVLADNLGIYADLCFKTPASCNSLEMAAAVVAYTGQIFCDFSGYTDIARGASSMLGYELPENFDYPYLSGSITEFWRRWHMTLSRWLRDYLYVPLGGNRSGNFATYRNLLLTMTLGGLWHGARMTFVFWGAYHGALLALHKLFVTRTAKSEWWKDCRRNSLYRVISVGVTLGLVMVGWVFFRAQSFSDAILVFRRLGSGRPPQGWWSSSHLPLDVTGWYLLAVVVLHLAGGLRLGIRTHDALPAPARGLLWAAIVGICYLFATASPTFIYFYF